MSEYCCDLFDVVSLSVFLSVVFFFKQKTAYEMRISDWSSDVCSSDLTVTENGVFNTSSYELEIKRTMRSVATEAFFVADSSKFGREALFKVFDLDRSEERRVGKECVSKGRSRGST